MPQTTDNHCPNFYLIMMAAGTGTRFQGDVPKQYQKINGVEILRHSTNKFIKNNNLKDFVNVINENDIDIFKKATQGLKNIQNTNGSNIRKNSVYNGLKYFSNLKNEDIILIHDAARPLIHEEDIQNLLMAIKNHNAATLAAPVKDTLFNNQNTETVDREDLWSIQTPQAFKYGALMAAHEQFKDDDSFTDDTGIMRAAGHHVEIVPAKHPNIKITTPDDFAIVKAMIESNLETRTASGFDVHAFEKEPSERKLMLGGIEVDHDLALTGHSDADVILHAITDALLGTINEGDIGTHFPPSDSQWKDAASDQFLKHAHDLLKSKNGQLNFVDVTVIAETPKIGGHREAMQDSIANILGVSPSRVSIKATTTEKLGFTGRKEGMACQALVTIKLPTKD